jgi:hypothetical protein
MREDSSDAYSEEIQVAEETVARFCDNHPDEPAHVVTTRGGVHAEVALCSACTPSHYEEWVGKE